MLQCIFRPQSLPGGSALCKAYFQILSRNSSLLRLRKPHFRKKNNIWGKMMLDRLKLSCPVLQLSSL